MHQQEFLKNRIIAAHNGATELHKAIINSPTSNNERQSTKEYQRNISPFPRRYKNKLEFQNEKLTLSTKPKGKHRVWEDRYDFPLCYAARCPETRANLIRFSTTDKATEIWVQRVGRVTATQFVTISDQRSKNWGIPPPFANRYCWAMGGIGQAGPPFNSD
ncbi:hypothetical protein CEXT_161381 [Caerostris extrusa]|uniref:Uncharacterized protein n=1 Tax=Caerostris extrusa TaxID=172846 RepID=A0AAV4NZH8_CAEEX|nr:hypothetical protein CEXT_161381 [Caerostris extrusa]